MNYLYNSIYFHSVTGVAMLQPPELGRKKRACSHIAMENPPVQISIGHRRVLELSQLVLMNPPVFVGYVMWIEVISCYIPMFVG